jgi:hypothetical protein
MTQTSNSTAIGVFDDYGTAEGVAQDLAKAGIPRESIEVHSNFKTAAADYAEAVRRGSAVVSVTAPPEQIEWAAKIMNERGAVDIDRRVSAFRQSGYDRHNPDAPAYSSEEAARERERYREMESGAAIPIVEEEPQADKRFVRRGVVHVYSHVVITRRTNQ